MNASSDDAMIDDMISFFGNGDRMADTAQWRSMVDGDAQTPICVINHVKIRPQAAYGPGENEPERSGLEAFLAYGRLSLPRIEATGGKMIYSGRFDGAFVGDDDDWNIAIVVSYPSRAAFVALFTDPEYRAAYRHRRAAVEKYRATVVAHVG